MHLKKIKQKIVNRKYIYMLKYKSGKYYTDGLYDILTEDKKKAKIFSSIEELKNYIDMHILKRGLRICKIDVTFK